MNRALLITIGIVIIILVFMAWLFLFFNGAPANTREVFSDLGIIKTTERTVDPYALKENDDRTVLNLSDGVLEQVTTEPVAGFATASTSGEMVLRYLERGTGYFFDVNLVSGLKNQTTPTSVPNATEAHFAPDLSHAVIITEREGRRVELVSFPLDTGTAATVTELDADAENIEFLDADTIAYTENTHTGTRGFTYDIDTAAVLERFRIAIPDATVRTVDDTVFAYPKPTRLLSGALYTVTNGTLTPASDTHLGFVPFVGKNVLVANYIADNAYQTVGLPNLTPQQILMLPEKCVTSSLSTKAWCGAPHTAWNTEGVENWYQGTLVADDNLFEVDVQSGAARELVVPKSMTGRQIDAQHLALSPEENSLFFQNKIDATLWLLKLTQ